MKEETMNEERLHLPRTLCNRSETRGSEASETNDPEEEQRDTLPCEPCLDDEKSSNEERHYTIDCTRFKLAWRFSV